MEFSYRSSPFRQIRTVAVRSAFHSTTAAEALAVRQITKGKNPPDISADIRGFQDLSISEKAPGTGCLPVIFLVCRRVFPGLGCRASAASADAAFFPDWPSSPAHSKPFFAINTEMISLMTAAAAMVPWISGAYSGAEPSRTDTEIPANTSDTPEWGSRVSPKCPYRTKQKSTTDVVLFSWWR